jgi:hypothetical protein
MLGRRSRVAEYLVKEAKRPGFIRRHPVASLAILGGGTAGAAVAAEDIRGAMKGLSPQYLAARRAGYQVPQVKSRYGYSALSESVDPSQATQRHRANIDRWAGQTQNPWAGAGT